jgi:hypothetical protein
MQMFWIYNLNFEVHILAFFVWQLFWATFMKIGHFFHSSGHTVFLKRILAYDSPTITKPSKDALTFYSKTSFLVKIKFITEDYHPTHTQITILK